MENKIFYGNSTIYDGWIFIFDLVTKEIQWRDFWIVDRLTQEEKTKIEQQFLKSLEDDTTN